MISAVRLPGWMTSHGYQRQKGNVRKLVKKGISPMHRSRVCRVSASQDDVPVDQLLAGAQEAARAGAMIVMDRVDKPRKVSFKGAADLVTDTDQASEEVILASLTGSFPDHAILGEEGGVSGNMSSKYLWCVDPIDGTTNFAHGYPSFSVSVAVLREGQPAAACVVEFVGGPGLWGTRTYSVSEGNGAFAEGKKISVSETQEVERSLLVTGFGYNHDEVWAANIEHFKHFTDVSQGVRRLGSAAVDMCHVGLGISEAFWEYYLKPWDCAAGVLIVKEAGGRVTTLDGKDYNVFNPSLLVSNGHIHDQILERTEPVTRALTADKHFDPSQWYVPEGYAVVAAA